MISMDNGDQRLVLYRSKDRIATITLNDPERLNALSHGPGSIEDELLKAFERADAADDVRVIVVTGEGRAFSSGGAGGRHENSAPEWYRFLTSVEEVHSSLYRLRKPIIGAINGMCYGVAMRLVAHFDILIAVEGAKFGLIETRFGATGVEPLPYLVGSQWAMFLALSGEIITAQKAKEIGLVLEVFPEDQFLDKVYDLARRIAAMPHVAVQMNRKLIHASMQMMGWDNAIEVARALNAITDSVQDEAVADDGRRFATLKADPKEFRTARDAPFRKPWLT